MNYRWINFPANTPQELIDRYNKLADQIENTATEPIAIVWAHPHEDWVDSNGVDPQRDCLLVTQHVTGESLREMTYGLNLSTHKLY